MQWAQRLLLSQQSNMQHMYARDTDISQPNTINEYVTTKHSKMYKRCSPGSVAVTLKQI